MITQELSVMNQNEISVAFNSPQGIQSIIDNIKSQVDEQINGIVWDFTKKKDRDTVASLAYKVGRSKTAIDAEGKKLKEKYTVFTKAIDADRKLAKEELEAEQARIRKPLDDWENAEKERKARLFGRVDLIKGFLSVQDHHTAKDIQEAISILGGMQIDETYQEIEQEAKLAKLETLEALRSLLVKREAYEAEQIELEALRQAEILRQQQERDAQIAREATEKANREAEEKARLEAERVQGEKQEAEQREQRLQAEKAEALQREEYLKQKAIDDAKQAEINQQKAIEAERERIEFERLAKEDAERKEKEKREKDQDHKRAVNQSIIAELSKLGIDEEKSKALILAIYKNQIPNIKITY